jgi:hypothetical protein
MFAPTYFGNHFASTHWAPGSAAFVGVPPYHIAMAQERVYNLDLASAVEYNVGLVQVVLYEIEITSEGNARG